MPIRPQWYSPERHTDACTCGVCNRARLKQWADFPTDEGLPDENLPESVGALQDDPTLEKALRDEVDDLVRHHHTTPIIGRFWRPLFLAGVSMALGTMRRVATLPLVPDAVCKWVERGQGKIIAMRDALVETWTEADMTNSWEVR